MILAFTGNRFLADETLRDTLSARGLNPRDLPRLSGEDVTPEDLGVDVAPRLKTLKVAEPPKRGAGIMVPDVATLVEKLKNEAKVIP